MKKPNIKIPKIILGIPIALKSLELYLAVVVGYYFAKFLAARISSVIFPLGNYTFHFHHWMMGVVGIILLFIYNFSPAIESIGFGFLGGLIFEGVSSYPDWHDIFKKKKIIEN